MDPVENVKYITGSGHGSNSAFKGHEGCHLYKNRCPLLGKGYDKAEVEDKIIHFQACSTAKSLGPDLVEKGCKAFFGYIDFYTAVDGYEEYFEKSDAEIDYAITDGVEAEMVYLRTEFCYNEAIRQLTEDDRFVGYLKDDLDFLRCPHHGSEWGDKRAKLI